MKTMERILSFVLALCMLVSMAPVPASAAEEGVCTCVAICTDGNTEPKCALCSAEGAVLTDVCRYGDLYIKEAVFSDLFGSPMASWSMVESAHNELQYVVRFYKTGLEAGASPTDTSQGTLAVACSTLKNYNYIDVSTKLPAGGNYFYTVYAGYNDNAAVNYENFIGNTVYSKVFTYESSKVALLYSWDGKLLEKEHIQGYEPGTVVALMTPGEDTPEAPAGMEFAGWGVVKDGSIVTHQPGDTITLKEETTVTAQFREKPYYSVTIVPDGSGGGIPVGGGQFQEGDTVTLSTTLETEAGFCSMTWNVNDYSFQLPGTIFEPQLTVSFTMPARDVTITADYRSHTYVFENLGDGTHIQQCFMCDDPLTEAVPHVDSDGDEACEDCGYSWHVHTLAESYEYDAEYHWRACTTCGTTNAIYEEHSFGTDWAHDGESHFHACVCGAVTDVTAHSYTEKKSDAQNHWTECVCGETNSIEAHSGGTATCTGKALCATCGVEYGSALGHAYDTLKSDGLEHWWECVCGEKSGVTAHFGGTAACDAHPVCGICGTLYGERLPHSYDTKKFDQEWHWWECECGERFNLGEHYGDEPTCSSQGLCYGCDEYFGTLLPHDYVNLNNDSLDHWMACACGERSELTPHSGGTATCTAKAVCSTCGAEYGKLNDHDYATQKRDAENHWMECVCGDKSEIAPHTGGEATCTETPKCETCGAEYGEAKGHSHTTQKHDENYHWMECICGDRSAVAPHQGGTATCTAKALCTTCGAGYGALKDHSHTIQKSDAENHWMECVCGEKSEITAHSGGQATCTALAKCETCGTGYGRLADHAYTTVKSDAETHWMECVCGEKTQPEAHSGGNPTCTAQAECEVCGTAYGDLAIHIYSLTWHSDETNHWQECTCGAKTEGKPHSYGADGVCTTCGYQLEVCTLTIHYANDGFDPGLESKTVTIPYGETVDLSDYWPEQLEYTENGKTWYLAGFTEEPDGFVILSTTTMTGDKTLRAAWATNPQVTVTFDPQGGSMDRTKMRHKQGAKIFLSLEKVPAPTREGYAFLGWSLTPEGAVVDENTKLQADTTLYAVWGYSLTLRTNIAALPTQVYSFAPGTEVDLSDYWPEELTYQSKGVTRYFQRFPFRYITMLESEKLMAVWSTTPHFTVSLDTQGGELPYKRERVPENTMLDSLGGEHIPTRQGFTFLGWATTPNGTPNQGTVTTDCTLYAIWQENAFTVGNLKYRIESENTVSVQSATLNAGTTILEIPADVVYGGKRYTVASLNANAISTGISTSLTAMLRHVTVYHLGHKPHIWGDFPEGVTVTFVEIWDATPSGLRWNAATKTLAWDALYDSGTTVESRYEATYEVAVYNAQTGMCLSKKATSTASASFANIFTVTNKQVYFSVTAYDRFGKPSRTVYSNQESLPQTCNDGAPNTATVGGEQVAIRVTDGTAVLDDFVTIGNTVVGVADTGATSIQVGKIATSQAAAQSGQATIQLDHGVTLVIGQSGWQALDGQTGEGQRVNLGAGALDITETQAPKDGDVVMSVNLLRMSAPSLDMADLVKLGVAGNYDSDITFADLKLLAVRALSGGDLRRIARNLSNAWLVTWCNQQADRAETADKLYCMISQLWLANILSLDQEQLAYVNALPVDLDSGKVKLEVHMIKDLLLNTEQLQRLSRSDAVSGDFKAWLQEAIAGEPGSTVNVLGGLDVNYTVGGSPVTITGGDFQYGMNLTLPDGVNPSQVSGCRVNEDGSLSPREITLTLLSGNLYRGVIQSDGNSTYIFVCESTVDLPPIPEHIHSYTSQKSDNNHHWMECECGERQNAEAHSGGEATCTDKAKCDTCGAEYGEAKGHSHTTQKHDETHHWLECACGDKKDVTSHTGGTATCTDKARCDTCGAEYGEAKGHSHTTQKHDDTHHWLECACGDKKDVTSHTGGTATCTDKARCDTCGAEYGQLAAHTSGGPATEDKAERCTVCGQELSPALGHTHNYTTVNFDAQNHWQECTCGEASGTAPHSGGTATCTGKAKCEICGAEYGEAKGHGDTELRDEQQPTCTQEGYTGDLHCIACSEALETGKTIPATGHSYVWKVDREPTTTQPGLKHEECACGARRSENTLIPQLTTPATGDDSSILLWCGLTVLSALALLWLLLKKRQETPA